MGPAALLAPTPEIAPLVSLSCCARRNLRQRHGVATGSSSLSALPGSALDHVHRRQAGFFHGFVLCSAAHIHVSPCRLHRVHVIRCRVLSTLSLLGLSNAPARRALQEVPQAAASKRLEAWRLLVLTPQPASADWQRGALEVGLKGAVEPLALVWHTGSQVGMHSTVQWHSMSTRGDGVEFRVQCRAASSRALVSQGGSLLQPLRVLRRPPQLMHRWCSCQQGLLAGTDADSAACSGCRCTSVLWRCPSGALPYFRRRQAWHNIWG